MQKLCCVRTRQQFSASWDHLSPAYLTISPSILNHFWWELYQALSDSDFANDKDTRECLWIHNFCGVPVGWKSKSMKSVVLSTTEAEYVAVSEVAKEIKFFYQMLRSMEVKVPQPIKVHVDNVGAIWLAKNSSVSERT